MDKHKVLPTIHSPAG